MVYTHFLLFSQYLISLYNEDPIIYIEYIINETLLEDENIEVIDDDHISYQIQNNNVRYLLNELPKIYNTDMSIEIIILKIDGVETKLPRKYECLSDYFPCYQITSDCINTYIINNIK